MPVVIEKREYQRPIWEEFGWEVWGQRIVGVLSELPGGNEKLRKVRVALMIPADAENVTIGMTRRNRIERSERETRRMEEECYVISYWSPHLKFGKLIMLPREVAERQEDGPPSIIQIETVAVYSYDTSGQPTYESLV